jgi:hypothetical protein
MREPKSEERESWEVEAEICKSVTGIIEKIKTEICDHYCKYPAIYDTREDSDKEYDKMIAEVCEHCPLNRL